MGRAKRSSKMIDKATRRAAALKAIDPALNLGAGLSIADYDGLLAAARRDLDVYNTALSAVDAAQNGLVASEKRLADLSERMLAGVAAKHG